MGKDYAARKKKADRPKGDFYGTPPSLLTELLKVDVFGSPDVLEPCCGKGYLSKDLKKIFGHVTAFDLYHGKNRQDFLKYNKKHTIIVTNPPFSQFDEFVLHAKNIADKVYMIGKMNFFGAYKRNKIGVWKNLKKIYCFNRQVDYRTPYRKDGHFHVGNLITGWFYWEKDFKGKPTFEIMDINKWATLGSYEKKCGVCGSDYRNNGKKHICNIT